MYLQEKEITLEMDCFDGYFPATGSPVNTLPTNVDAAPNVNCGTIAPPPVNMNVMDTAAPLQSLGYNMTNYPLPSPYTSQINYNGQQTSVMSPLNSVPSAGCTSLPTTVPTAGNTSLIPFKYIGWNGEYNMYQNTCTNEYFTWYSDGQQTYYIPLLLIPSPQQSLQVSQQSQDCQNTSQISPQQSLVQTVVGTTVQQEVVMQGNAFNQYSPDISSVAPQPQCVPQLPSPQDQLVGPTPSNVAQYGTEIEQQSPSATTVPPKKKYDDLKYSDTAQKKKLHAEVLNLTLLALRGDTIIASQNKMKLKKETNVYYFVVDQIIDSNSNVILEKEELLDEVRTIEGREIGQKQKLLVISREMQKMYDMLEDDGCVVNIKGIKEKNRKKVEVKNVTKFPIANSVTFSYHEVVDGVGVDIPVTIDYKKCEVGKELFEKVFKKKMEEREFTIKQDDILVMYSSFSLEVRTLIDQYLLHVQQLERRE